MKKLEEKSVVKRYVRETHRLCSPKKTVDRILKLAPAFGITRVADITGLDILSVPTYLACRPNSRSLSVSQGKGLTKNAAKASALMESVEHYHAERISLPLLLGSYRDLRHSHNLSQLSEFPRRLGSKLDENTRLLWIEGYDLISRRNEWVPYELVHLDYRTPLPEGHGYFMSSSNGLSSGNHFIEAVNHGICELIERDSLALWHASKLDKRRQGRIDLSSINSQKCRQILNKFTKARLNVGVWDITSDIGIPAFLCRIISPNPPPLSQVRPASGAGCHLNKEIALLRALTEAAQSRLTFISGARDDLDRAGYALSGSQEFYHQWKSEISCASAERSFSEIFSCDHDDFVDDMKELITRLRRRGANKILIFDLTKIEFNIPVVRTLIPFLDGYYPSSETPLSERARNITKGGP